LPTKRGLLNLMMRLRDFRLLLLLLTFSVQQAFAQVTIKGQVRDFAGPLSGVRVTALNKNIVTTTDSAGHFSFTLPNSLNAEVRFSKDIYRDTILTLNSKSFYQIEMRALGQVLSSVIIQDDTRKRNYGYLRSVEGTAIYAGKKTEVIRMDHVIANLSTNNAREIYAKVAGLNIWESEGGLQLNIGGRGLNPNRAANFNVRQNGHDISADALGYPESYYTPPAEAVESIEIVRGAASLQYGTQFGGLINFVMRKPVKDKKFEFVSRESVASYGLFNTFNSVSGTNKKLGYYAYVQYKRADGWRPNSQYNNISTYAHLDYAISPRSTVAAEYTYLNYLSQQAGGLSDKMFNEDPTQSNRERNWFGINWNLLNLTFDQKVGENGKINVRAFGLLGSRKAIGFMNYRTEAADGTDTYKENRELVIGNFKNFGVEARYLQPYTLFGLKSTGLIGARNYQVSNTGRQGLGNSGYDANFRFIATPENYKSDYKYPNFNQSIFLENIIYLKSNLTITPGVRYEYINTTANGSYREVVRDLAGNLIKNEVSQSSLGRKRSFVIAGLGFEHKTDKGTSIYTNISQNFRAITFSDIHITNPSFEVDTNIRDERGFSWDIGIRNQSNRRFRYDLSSFLLSYGNRIGDARFEKEFRLISKRSNIGKALIFGFESFVTYDLIKQSDLELNLFSNLTVVESEYIESYIANVKGNDVEFVPTINFKGGLETQWKTFRARVQGTYLSKQYSDANNDINGGPSAVTGIIPAFKVFDLGVSKQWKLLKLETGVNNLTNEYYFTRRATGYPGPGIIPSSNRSFYVALQFKY
jgi:Fe(3+) dicitrate transport protein